MRLSTRPRKGQTYTAYMNEWATALGALTNVTSASALTAGTPHGSGRLAPEHLESFRLADYAVYSYATPIAWHVPGTGWVMPEDKYSLTTTSHQRHIRVTLEHTLGLEVSAR